MRFGAVVLATFMVCVGTCPAESVETYSSSQFRRVIAKARIPQRDNTPLYFSVRGGTFWTDQVSTAAPGDGVYYQFSGSVDLRLDGKTRTLEAGDARFIPAGAMFTLMSHGTHRAPTYLHFLLSRSPYQIPPQMRTGGRRVVPLVQPGIGANSRAESFDSEPGAGATAIAARSAAPAHRRRAALRPLWHRRRVRSGAGRRARPRIYLLSAGRIHLINGAIRVVIH